VFATVRHTIEGEAMGRRATVVGVGVAALSLGVTALTGGAAQASSPFTVVVSGLNNPRGVAFDAAGNLFVSEAGQYNPSGTQPNGGSSTTGRVDKYSASGSLVWSTSFTSIYDLDPQGHPEVLGPAGLSAVGNGCGQAAHSANTWTDVPGKSCDVLVIMNESQAAHPGVSELGHLYRVQGATGAVHRDVSNVGNQMYAWTDANKDQPWAPHYPAALGGGPQFPDSNPYAVLTTRDRGQVRTFVADAGANTISEIMPNGTAHVIAYLPNSPVSDAIPTCIAQGPDGALYVGTLHLLDLFYGKGPGTGQVYKVDPNFSGSDPTQNATLWASGLTTVTGCAFDGQGNFWASEMFYPGSAGPPGDIAEIKAGDAGQTSYGDPATGVTHYPGFPLPGGVAVGPDGGIYTTILANSATPNSGAVVRANLTP
jgi:hypothetical protein